MKLESAPDVVIKETERGKGLFAPAAIAAGTVIFSVDVNRNRLAFDETKELDDRESYALQIGLSEYVLLKPPLVYANHSCQPNCGFNAAYAFFALRDIAAGEELVWDYSTSMFEHNWNMKCQCGSALCRKIVRDFNLLPSKLQQEYLRLGIVLPYIVEAVYSRANK